MSHGRPPHLWVGLAQKSELVVPCIRGDAVQVVGRRTLDTPVPNKKFRTEEKIINKVKKEKEIPVQYSESYSSTRYSKYISVIPMAS